MGFTALGRPKEEVFRPGMGVMLIRTSAGFVPEVELVERATQWGSGSVDNMAKTKR